MSDYWSASVQRRRLRESIRGLITPSGKFGQTWVNNLFGLHKRNNNNNNNNMLTNNDNSNSNYTDNNKNNVEIETKEEEGDGEHRSHIIHTTLPPPPPPPSTTTTTTTILFNTDSAIPALAEITTSNDNLRFNPCSQPYFTNQKLSLSVPLSTNDTTFTNYYNNTYKNGADTLTTDNKATTHATTFTAMINDPTNDMPSDMSSYTCTKEQFILHTLVELGVLSYRHHVNPLAKVYIVVYYTVQMFTYIYYAVYECLNALLMQPYVWLYVNI